MRTAILIVWIMILSSLTFITFQIRYTIDDQNRHLNKLYSQILRTQSHIDILESEWSYLSSPERISILSERHLPDWSSVRPEQLLAVIDLPDVVSGIDVGVDGSGGGVIDLALSSERLFSEGSVSHLVHLVSSEDLLR